MPIPAPIIDDRSYQQLRDELVRRIPVYTPEWTDHNPSDPGITLIELFAFLGENLLFRFNQIPEATKLAFLRLLRIPLLPAVPARSLLVLSTEEPAGVLVPLESEARAGSVPFETKAEVHVWPISSVAVARISTAAPDPKTEPEAAEFTLRALDALGELKPDQAPAYYETQTVPADETKPPVDFGASVDRMLWIALVAGKGADPVKLAGGLINVGFVPDAQVLSMDEVKTCPGADANTTSSPVEWQISTGEIKANSGPVYKSVTVEGDTTRGLSQQGVIRLRMPKKVSEFGVFTAGDEDLRGTGAMPPVLDEETEPKIICWLRAFRHDGGSLEKVRLVAVNATDALQSRKALPEFVGTGTGQPNQVYRLTHRPILDRTVRLEVEEDGAWRRWTEADSFHASSPDDRHYIVDRESAEIRFGTVVHGMAPQTGQRIRTVEYRYGGGVIGSVAAKAINKLLVAAAVKVVNPLPAFGGGESEPIEAALERIPGELRRRDRAVTKGDFRELALMTPGQTLVAQSASHDSTRRHEHRNEQAL